MRTEELIQSLARDVRPVKRHAVGQRIALGMLAGAAIALFIIASLLGLRSDLALAMQGFTLWMKWGYTISLGIIAIVCSIVLARPEPTSIRWAWMLCIPILLLIGIGISELAHAPSGTALAMWLGTSWQICPWLVFALSLPIFAGLLWSYRHFAPTRLRAAGAAAGLSSGAWAATLYCLHCPEASALFVLTWYTLGIGFSTLFGAWAGPRLLRW